MKKRLVILMVLVVFMAVFSSADVDTGYPCAYGCELLNDESNTYYCNPETNTCFLQESAAAVNQTPNVTETIAAQAVAATTEEKINTLEQNLVALQESLTQVTSGVSLTSEDIQAIKLQLSSLENDLTVLKSNIELLSNTNQQINSQTGSLATGLAGLQNSVQQTQQTLDSVQQTLDEKQSLNNFLTIAFLILLAIGVGGGIIYYLTRKQKNINPEIINYITNNIKQGKKFSEIKQNLLKAGWSEEDVSWAYKQTVKQNYSSFKQGSSDQKDRKETKKTAPGFTNDPKKMISIAIVSVLLIAGILLLLRGVSTGKAIEFQKLIGGQKNGTSGEVTYAVECTPPHILNPAKDGCCLDTDNSGVCDTTEARQGQVTGGACNDNNQCPRGEYCINKKCGNLAALYTGQGDCTKMCNYYVVKMLTSDGETYSIKPKRGSYTAAGALEWKLLEMPQYCKGETAIVPINIIRKRTGEVVNEEVITLKQGETSQVLTHPDLPKIAFTLTADTVYESCPK